AGQLPAGARARRVRDPAGARAVAAPQADLPGAGRDGGAARRGDAGPGGARLDARVRGVVCRDPDRDRRRRVRLGTRRRGEAGPSMTTGPMQRPGQLAEPGARPRGGAGDELPPLSPAQRRLWFLDRLDPGGWSYNVPLFLRLTGPLEAAA